MLMEGQSPLFSIFPRISRLLSPLCFLHSPLNRLCFFFKFYGWRRKKSSTHYSYQYVQHQCNLYKYSSTSAVAYGSYLCTIIYVSFPLHPHSSLFRTTSNALPSLPLIMLRSQSSPIPPSLPPSPDERTVEGAVGDILAPRIAMARLRLQVCSSVRFFFYILFDLFVAASWVAKSQFIYLIAS